MDLRAGDIDELYPLELSLPRVAKYSFSPDGPEDIRKVKKHPLSSINTGSDDLEGSLAMTNFVATKPVPFRITEVHKPPMRTLRCLG